MVLLSEEPEETTCIRQQNLKLNLQQLLDDHGGSIPLFDFEFSYESKFKEKLDYHFFGLEDIDTLCTLLNLVVKEEFGELVIMPGKINKVRFMSTRSPDVYEEIEEILATYISGIPRSCVSCLETRYQREFKRSLDYHSLGVNNIGELLEKMRGKGMVLLYEEPRTKETYLVSARMEKVRQERVKHNVQQLLSDRRGSIPLIDFEASYEYRFKEKLDYHSLGLKNLDHLCRFLNLVVEAPYAGERVIKINLPNMSTDDVYREIQKILGIYFLGLPMFSLSDLEREYQSVWERSLDYKSLGVTNIKQLLDKMRRKGMVVFYEKPENKITYVMCARKLKSRQRSLKLMVQELLDENGCEIPLIDFEDSYRNKFKLQLDYHYYGLKDFDSLCQVSNLVVEAGNSRGKVVKKAPEIYILRKRKAMG